ncbi:hypothetical protein IXX73_21785, partial [Escherichia coli]
QPARGAVAVFPRLSRAADAHQVAVVIPPVVTVIHQAVQVLALYRGISEKCHGYVMI